MTETLAIAQGVLRNVGTLVAWSATLIAAWSFGGRIALGVASTICALVHFIQISRESR